MSEYQYYEFLAIDRALDRKDMAALRNLSSRARITPARFVNTYDWGNFKGDPLALMRQWFDLHLYIADWGTRQFMMRVPARLMDMARIEPFLAASDYVTIERSGDDLIIDISVYEVMQDEVEYEENTDLAPLVPLRADLMAGDLGLFHLAWLLSVQSESVEPDDLEPEPWTGTRTPALESLSDLLLVDPDLFTAMVEGPPPAAAPAADDPRTAVAALPDEDKTDLLVRLLDDDPHVAADLRRLVHPIEAGRCGGTRRTAGDLRKRAAELAEARARERAEREAAAERAAAERAEQARRAHIQALRDSGDKAWERVEAEIAMKQAPAYLRAVALLRDLREIAREDCRMEAFEAALADLRRRHAKKGRLLEELAALD